MVIDSNLVSYNRYKHNSENRLRFHHLLKESSLSHGVEWGAQLLDSVSRILLQKSNDRHFLSKYQYLIFTFYPLVIFPASGLGSRYGQRKSILHLARNRSLRQWYILGKNKTNYYSRKWKIKHQFWPLNNPKWSKKTLYLFVCPFWINHGNFGTFQHQKQLPLKYQCETSVI